MRDSIHSHDVKYRFIREFFAAPRCGEVYNLGGGRAVNSVPILEAFDRAAAVTGKSDEVRVHRQESRGGPTSATSSDLRKNSDALSRMEHHQIPLDDTFEEIVRSWR